MVRVVLTGGPGTGKSTVLSELHEAGYSVGIDADEASAPITRYPYDATFVFPPWEGIYCMDDERDHTFAHSVQVYEFTCNWYRRHKLDLIEVPLGSVDVR